jgi:redox-sensitive bicupin YhaK (pirin superfamily)
MIAVRKSGERGHFDYGWLDTRHTFSFDRYYDPAYMGFRSLRVINEDRVAAGRGFPMHPQRDMEILTYVVEGALEHRDSIGTGSVIRPGEVQRMSAGTGITHSEFNPSASEPVHLLQIWILPGQKGLTPEYEQKFFAPKEKRGRLRLVAAPDGADGAITIHQDARVYAALLEPGDEVAHEIAGRHAWVQVIRGAVEVNGSALGAGDGAAVSKEPRVSVRAAEPSELLVFDLA